MKIVLEIIEGVVSARKRALRAPVKLVVGRSEVSDWMLPDDPTMSSRHFEVSVQLDGCFVTDLNSTNGTLVDGQRISRHPITDGIKIKAGSTVFQAFILQPAAVSTRIAGLESPQDEPLVEPPTEHKPQSIAPKQPKPIQPIPVSEALRQTDLIGQVSAETLGATTAPPTAGERIKNDDFSRSVSRPMTGAVIEVVSEYGRGRKSILRSGQSITVGRTEQSDFVIPDPQLSATHFTLADGRSGWQLADLDSTAGTSVNGTKISTTLVNTGDRVVAGQTQFLVTIGESAPLGGRRDDSSYPFQKGVRDDDPQVRQTAIHAAAWCSEPWLLDFCRGHAKEPSPDNGSAIEMLCILGLPSDLDLVRSVARCANLGPSRFEFLASFAHPAVVSDLLNAIKGDDLKDAVAAGLAFSRITGVDIASDQRATLPPEGNGEDEMDEEFAEEVMLPDSDKAERRWQRLAKQIASGTRFQQGLNTSGTPTPELLQQLDMRSRWEACLRGKYEGKWNGNPFELERFLVQELFQVQR